MNLPSLYARVCAKRPDLAVNADDGPWTLAHAGTEWDWLCHSIDDDVWRCEDLRDTHAAALILARWVEALPEYHVLANIGKITPRDVNWLVYEMGTGGDYTDPGRDCSDTPIEALAAFYLVEQ